MLHSQVCHAIYVHNVLQGIHTCILLHSNAMCMEYIHVFMCVESLSVI